MAAKQVAVVVLSYKLTWNMTTHITIPPGTFSDHRLSVGLQ